LLARARDISLRTRNVNRGNEDSLRASFEQ
jgi:hypothetical protein